MPGRRWKLACVLLVAQFVPVAFGPATDPIRVAVVCAPGRSYEAAADALTARLEAERCTVRLFRLPRDADSSVWKQVAAFRPSVVAAGGTDAAQEALERTRVPVVFFMVPNARDASFMQPGFAEQRRVSGVTSDVPPSAWTGWVRRAAPQARRVVVLHSARTERTADAIRAAGRTAGLEVRLVAADRGAFPKAIDDLNAAAPDAVVMIPDAQVYNAANVQRLLLWGVRQRRPVFSFSRQAVDAGAFAGLQCDPGQVGRQAAVLVREAGTRPGSGLRYPEQIDACLNRQTAETIGLDVPRDVAAAAEVLGGKP